MVTFSERSETISLTGTCARTSPLSQSGLAARLGASRLGIDVACASSFIAHNRRQRAQSLRPSKVTKGPPRVKPRKMCSRDVAGAGNAALSVRFYTAMRHLHVGLDVHLRKR